jgi:hypothetical protein
MPSLFRRRNHAKRSTGVTNLPARTSRKDVAITTASVESGLTGSSAEGKFGKLSVCEIGQKPTKEYRNGKRRRR